MIIIGVLVSKLVCLVHFLHQHNTDWGENKVVH